MQIARAILISLAAAVAPALALQCSGSLKPYCCSTTALTPRGYTGSDCVDMGQSSCAHCGLCCQHLQGKVAFYCGFPEDPNNSVCVVFDRRKGGPQDFCEAIEWYLKAAKSGHTLTQFNVGVCTTKDEACSRTSPSHDHTITWFVKAATPGYAGAQLNVGSNHHGRTAEYLQDDEAFEESQFVRNKTKMLPHLKGPDYRPSPTATSSSSRPSCPVLHQCTSDS
ncbi:hypothetical protein BGZ88_001343 [Linnemannia elongata]|nr:hypothetical protein BGZ88_001343 [Linnemannia elongata]